MSEERGTDILGERKSCCGGASHMTFLTDASLHSSLRSSLRGVFLCCLLVALLGIGVLMWSSWPRQLACAHTSWHIRGMTTAHHLWQRLQVGDYMPPLPCSAALDQWSSACHLSSNVTTPTNSSRTSVLEMYVLYHNREAHSHMFSPSSQLYRGLSLLPSATRPNTTDIEATAHLPILNNRFYQKQLCEYGGFFSLLSGGFLSTHGREYIGLQSWKAAQKGVALSCPAEKALGSAVEKAVTNLEDTFFFWSCPSKADRFMRFYWGCEHLHGNCQNVFRNSFSNLFGPNPPDGLEDGLPPMPDGSGEWSYMSYFALPAHQLQRYLAFAALFFSSLDDIYHHQLSRGICPHDSHRLSPKVGAERCLSFMMERLVNVWAYHSSIEMVYVDPRTGALKVVHERHNRRSSKGLRDWFAPSNVDRLVEGVRNASSRERNGRHVIERLMPRRAKIGGRWGSLLELPLKQRGSGRR